MKAVTLPHPLSKPKLFEKTKASQAEKQIDFLLKKHFENDPDQRPLLLKLADCDPTDKKKHLAWLVKHWTDSWNPTDADLKQIAQQVETHHKRSKYFSPLSWTRLRLEEAGYHAGIFRYSPATLNSLDGQIAEMIRIDEEDKQIRKGNLVITGGAEVAYKNERWTLLRVRSNEALRRLGQATSWCVSDGNRRDYDFPFDFLLNNEGERFLANFREVFDRWNRRPTLAYQIEIDRTRAVTGDGYDRASVDVENAIRSKKRQDAEIEAQVVRYPDLAIRYAEKVIGGKWDEFEKHVRVATRSAIHAADYAIKCRRERWQRFENKIKKSVQAVAQYREAFPNSIPKTSEEIFQDKLTDWRQNKAKAKRPWQHLSIQWQAESRRRNVDFADCLLLNYADASINRYARLIASMATSEIASEYRQKTLSYFEETKNAKTQIVNHEIGPSICARIRRRLPEIEMLIADQTEILSLMRWELRSDSRPVRWRSSEIKNCGSNIRTSFCDPRH